MSFRPNLPISKSPSRPCSRLTTRTEHRPERMPDGVTGAETTIESEAARGYNRHGSALFTGGATTHADSRLDPRRCGIVSCVPSILDRRAFAALNTGVLPADYYALPEQSNQGPIPDVLNLKLSSGPNEPNETAAGLAVATVPPRPLGPTRRRHDLRAQGRSNRGTTSARRYRRRD